MQGKHGLLDHLRDGEVAPVADPPAEGKVDLESTGTPDTGSAGDAEGAHRAYNGTERAQSMTVVLH